MLKGSFLVAWPFLISLGMVFIITFVVFPGTSDDTGLKFLRGVSNYASWYNLLMVTIFNICDTVGRFMGGQPRFTLPDKVIIILSYCRAIFIVTFMLIAYAENPSWLFGENADWFKIINMMLFAFSNGYVST